MSIHTKDFAEKYNKLAASESRFGRTDFLVTKELPAIISKYNVSSTILDFGCGAGLSTRFLKSLGYACIGVDSNAEILKLAIQNDPDGHYLLSKDDFLPLEDNQFQMVTSVFVLFEIASLEKMIDILTEISRALKPGGVFIAVTGSEELYQRDWLSLEVKSFIENAHPKSGDVCRIKLTDIDLVLNDYYWTHDDYVYAASNAGFILKKTSLPLGTADDGMQWKDEAYYPPFVFYEFVKQ